MKQITHEQLKVLLKRNPVRFTFTKINGEVRDAYGTTNLSKIPKSSHPKGGNGPNGTTCYFDLEKSSWRSISVNQIIKINE